MAERKEEIGRTVLDYDIQSWSTIKWNLFKSSILYILWFHVTVHSTSSVNHRISEKRYFRQPEECKYAADPGWY